MFEPDPELDWWAYTVDLQVVFEPEDLPTELPAGDE